MTPTATLPSARRGTSPWERAVAPALLFHSEVYRDLSWYLPNIIGNLHAKQEWEVFHPMMVGDTVRTRATVVERYVKRTREYVVNEVLVTDGDPSARRLPWAYHVAPASGPLPGLRAAIREIPPVFGHFWPRSS